MKLNDIKSSNFFFIILLVIHCVILLFIALSHKDKDKKQEDATYKRLYTVAYDIIPFLIYIQIAIAITVYKHGYGDFSITPL